MTESELSIKLREDARRIGLCDQWYGEWKDETTMQELINKYKKGLDFALKHRWPSLQFIKTHFPQEVLRENGILVDDIRSYPVRNPATRRLIYIRNYVLLGESHGVIRYSFKSHTCNVWVRDTSTIRVEVKYGSFILIHLFDKAKADVKTDMVSKICVIKHSPDVSIKQEGMVTIRNEFNYLK